MGLGIVAWSVYCFVSFCWTSRSLVKLVVWAVRGVPKFPLFILHLSRNACLWTFTAICVASPLVVVLGNAWLWRETLIQKCVKYVSQKKSIHLNAPKIEASVSAKKLNLALSVSGVGIHDQVDGGDEGTELVAVERVSVDCSINTKTKKLVVLVTVEGLKVNYVAYNMLLTDTNLKRLQAKCAPETTTEDVPQTPPPTKKSAQGGWVEVKILIKNATIVAKSHGALAGTRAMIPPIVLREETIDPANFSSIARTVLWVNLVVARTLANSGAAAFENAFDTVGGIVPGGEYVVGAGKQLIGGVTDGVGNVVYGFTDGGQALADGFMSGSPTGAFQGVANAGTSVVGGVFGGVSSIAGGIEGGVYRAAGQEAPAEGKSVADGIFGSVSSIFLCDNANKPPPRPETSATL